MTLRGKNEQTFTKFVDFDIFAINIKNMIYKP